MPTSISRHARKIVSALGLLGGALAMAACLAQSQTVTATPKFEVASIKPCSAEDTPPNGRSGGSFDTLPGRLTVRCMTVINLVATSVRYGNKPLLNDSSRPNGGERISGGPAWIHSDRYTIDAKAEGTSSARMMMGAMPGALLEERFQLKTHREKEQIPMYALTVAKGGLKLKLMEEGGCTPQTLLLRGSPLQARSSFAALFRIPEARRK